MKRLALALLFLSAPAAAQDSTTIWGFTKCAAPMRTMQLEAAIRSNSGWQDILAGMYRCDDEALAAGTAAAGDSGDLKAAVKELYIKDRAYVSSFTEGRMQRATAEHERAQALDRVRMEAKAAGK